MRNGIGLLACCFVAIIGCSGPTASNIIQSSTPTPIAAAPSQEPKAEQLVRIQIPMAGHSPDELKHQYEVEVTKWAALEDSLTAKVKAAKVGELDGDEASAGHFTIYFYGPDAEKLAAVLTEAVKGKVPPGTTLFLRHGDVKDPSAKTETRTL